MTHSEYHIRYNAILERFHVAYNLSCYRTARARLHELASLTHEYTQTVNPHVLYLQLLRKYDVADKILNIR